MDLPHLRDKVAKGMGLAARKLGIPVIVYRPTGPDGPLTPANRVIKLFAQFEGADASGTQAGQAGAMWHGFFDTAYTQPGDYLVGVDYTYFVGTQEPLLPARCILTNRLVTVVRPTFVGQAGYSGLYSSDEENVVVSWPASILASGSHAGDARPNTSNFGDWSISLPISSAQLRPADVISDDLGATYVVGGVEKDRLGWRVLVRQIGG